MATKTVFELIEDKISSAIHHTDSEIADIHYSLIPQLSDLNISFIKSSQYRFNNNTYSTEDYIVAKVEGIKEMVYPVTKKEDVIYNLSVEEAVKLGKVHPFAIFKDGLNIPWSQMRIVKDVRYSYLFLPRDKSKDIELQIDAIQRVQYLYFPFNVFYTENRQLPPDPSYKEFLRFSLDGQYVESGKVVFYVSNPNFEFKEIGFANGDIHGYDIEVDDLIRLNSDNFIVFKNRLLDTSEKLTVNRMNLLYLQGEAATYRIKVFYRTDLNTPYNIVNKFPNKTLAKNIVQGKEDSIPRIDKKVLNTPFDFELTNDKNYRSNVRSNYRYMTAYDSSFLSSIYKDINVVETTKMSGKEVLERVDIYGMLKVCLLKYDEKETRVLVFCNGILYKHYSDLTYLNNTFTIPIDVNEVIDSDEFEFVYLKGINNYMEYRIYALDNKLKSDNPLTDEEMVIYTQDTSDNQFTDKVNFNERTWYKVDFTVDEDKNIIVDDKYLNTELLIASKKQFKYYFRRIQEDTIKIRLSPDFIAAQNPNQYVVFVNGKMLNRTFYRLILQDRDNVFTDPYIYTRLKFRKGDRVEVFYLPVELTNIDYTENMITELVTMNVTKDYQISFMVPYPFKLYTNEDNFMLFLDSMYVDSSRYTVKNGILLFNDGTKILKGSVLTFIFIYNECQEQESAIYLNNANGVYMENIYLEVDEDGQTLFNLGSDRYIDYLIAGNSVMILYKGLYVPVQFFDVDKYNGLITFAPNSFKAGDVLNVIIFHMPEEVMKSEVNYIADEEGVDEIDTGEIKGLPFVYYVTMSAQEFLEQPMTSVRNKIIEYSENVIDTKTKLYLAQYGYFDEKTDYNTLVHTIDGMAASAAVAGFPFTKYHSMTFDLRNPKSVLERQIMDYITAAIDQRSDKYMSLYGYTTTNAVNVDFSAQVVQTELQMNAIEDEMYELTKNGLGDYASEGRPTFVIRNNLLLTEGVHYTMIPSENKIRLKDPLKKGEHVYILSYWSSNKYLKSYEHNIEIEDVNQLEYDLYDIFGSIKNIKQRFIVYLGGIVVDPRRYDISTPDYKLKFHDNTSFMKGRHIRIVALYVDESASIYTHNYLGSSKYHAVDQITIPFEKDVYTYKIPFPDMIEKDAGFMIMCGSILVDNSKYVINKLDGTITFLNETDPMFRKNTEFQMVFFSDDMRTIKVDSKMGEKIEKDRKTYDIPVPFKNYFQVGNSIIVFVGSQLVDTGRFDIDAENNTLTFKKYEGYAEGQSFRFVFIYQTGSKNISFTNEEEDLSIATIRRSGYIFINKNNLVHPLDKELFWLFLNGKKVPLEDITNISSNIIRIHKDQRSRYNLVLLSHTPEEDALKPYFKTYSNYDTLINNLTIDDLNALFNTHRLLSDTEIKMNMDVTREALINEIVRDWYGKTNIANGAPFVNSYVDITGQTSNVITSTKDVHNTVLDASEYFSAVLNRDNINKDTPLV